MFELSKIFLVLIAFNLTLLVPFNIFHKNVFLSKCTPLDIAAFNLILNCSLLLSLSLIPFPLDNYNLILYILIIIYFFY